MHTNRPTNVAQLLDRATLQRACTEYKKKGLTSIDCRSAAPLLQAELTRLGYFETKKNTTPLKPPPQREKVVPTPTSEMIIYNVYTRLPASILLRIQPPIIDNKQFWSTRLARLVPPKLIPTWLEAPPRSPGGFPRVRVSSDSIRDYTLRVNNEMVGRLTAIGGSYDMEWGRSLNDDNNDLTSFADFKEPIRLISDSGPLRFVGVNGLLYRFHVESNRIRFLQMFLPKEKGTIRQVGGLDDFLFVLYEDGELYKKGHYHSLPNVVEGRYKRYRVNGDEPILEVSISASHLTIKTETRFFVVGKNKPKEITGHPPGTLDTHLPYPKYAKLWSPVELDVPGETYKVIAGDDSTYALTRSGEVWVLGSANNYLGVDLAGATSIHQWKKVVLPPITKLVTSYYHTIALDVEGRVHGWGQFRAKEFGQTRTPIILPQLLFGEGEERVLDIETSRWRSSLLTTDRRLYIHGAYEANSIGQNGNRVAVDAYLVPKTIEGVKLCRSHIVGSVVLI